ncbi:hypothetical protein BKA65DRAFT_551627 [Rhexocercosporidium sp. MPI-PUGE-AT-0058]|nr:hypothetical protein BKA65DRAFT_551627 [Rhexocercosporidium sp. MPI-PUGE-AT-0058]
MNGQNSSSSGYPNGADLNRMESLSISPELFEKLYLSPENNVHGDLRNTFGNPTPLAVVGFVVALTPLSIELMGWGGVTGLSATAYVYLSNPGTLINTLLSFKEMSKLVLRWPPRILPRQYLPQRRVHELRRTLPNLRRDIPTLLRRYRSL